MKIPDGIRKGAALILAATAVFAVFLAWERPWFLHWGAAPFEVDKTFAGDDLIPGAAEAVTRGITIQTNPDRVWPWVAQLGQDRGGFYSYEVLEDAVGCQMPRATTILPWAQQWERGDKLWMYPPDKLAGVGGARLVAHEPGRHLVFAVRQIGTRLEDPEDGIWGFHLYPVGPNTTRLVARGSGKEPSGALARLVGLGFLDPAHYVMERRMLLNIKTLAEGGMPSRRTDEFMVLLWILTVGILLVALVEVTRRQEWGRPLLVATCAALAFQLLTLLQPPVALGTVLVLALGVVLWWPRPRAGFAPAR